MKNGKKPNRNHKIALKKQGLNPDNWLIVKDLTHEGKLVITENLNASSKTEKDRKPVIRELVLT